MESSKMKIEVDREDIFEAWECLCRLSNFAKDKLDEREKSNLVVAQNILTRTLNQEIIKAVTDENIN